MAWVKSGDYEDGLLTSDFILRFLVAKENRFYFIYFTTYIDIHLCVYIYVYKYTHIYDTYK